ncbi:hypothetical protein EGW08_004737 [Elysia chlorotica]|uniref:DUF4371 domain-containing protein n=1 Tax=Elysia chlorotica TaxID=188477 RepID=A0A3S0ZV42_ELYCH|nr:hypothetical protein EGW08_004737 [Elysia chlorotica]
MVLAVMAENNIPLALTPVIIDLAKACITDPQALAELKLSASSAAYKICFGLARTDSGFVIELQMRAQISLFRRIQSVKNLKEGSIQIHHLASVEISKADSLTIYSAVVDIFEKNNLPWGNLVSILSDSCAVMRGHISGVEKRTRDEKAHNLLNIDGDMQIIAKKFCSHLGGKMESLFSALHTDFKWCLEFKMYLSEICSILNIPFTIPQMCSGTRWLSGYDRALETMNLMDAYQAFYFAFLCEKDRDLYRPRLKKVLDSHNVDMT